MNPQGAPLPPGGGFPGGPGPRGGLFLLPPAVMLVVVLLGVLVAVVAFWQIYRKAGHSGALGLLMLVPVVNVVAMLWLAFSEWPIEKRLREARAMAALAVEPAPPAPDVTGA